MRSELLGRLRDLAIIVPKTGFGGVDVNNNWRISCLLPRGFSIEKTCGGALALKKRQNECPEGQENRDSCAS